MADTRIYLVTTRSGAAPTAHLVRASHPSRAIAHVVEKLGITAEVADQEELVDAVMAGLKVETAE